MNAPTHPHLDGVIRASAGLLLAAGLIVCTGWWFGLQDLTRLIDASTFVQFYTGLSFALIGVGIADGHRPFRRLSDAAALIAVAIGVLTLIEYLFGIDLYFDHWVPVAPASPGAPYPGRIAANTATCFVIAGGALLLLRHASRHAWIPAVASMFAALILATGGTALLGYLFGVTVAAEWAGWSRMAFVTSLCFVLIGISVQLLVVRVSTGPSSQPGYPWLPVSAGVLVAAMSLLIWRALHLQGPDNGFGMDESVLLLGLLLATLIAALLGQSRSLRLKSRALESVNRELQMTSSIMLDLYNQAPCGYHALDAEGYFQRVNTTECAWLGRSEAELVGKRRLVEFLTPESRAVFLRQFPILKAKGQIRDVELDLVRGDGSTMTVLVSATAVYDASGAYTRSRTTLYDISARRRAEQSERLLSAVVEHSADAIITETTDGIISSWNEGAVAIFGYSADEMIGQPITRLIPTGALDDRRHILETLNHGERVSSFDTQRLRKDGKVIEVSVTISPLFDTHGKVIGASKIARDISHLQRTQKALRAANDELRQSHAEITRLLDETRTLSSALDQERMRLKEAQAIAHIGSWSIDHVRDVTSWSDETFRIFGLQPQALIPNAETFMQRVHPDDRATVLDAFQGSLNSHTTYVVDHRMLLPGGETIHLHQHGEHVYDADGHPLRSIGTCQDITARLQAEASMRQAQAIFASTHEAIIVFDPSGTTLAVNPAYSRITGYAPEQAIGKPTTITHSDRHDETYYAMIWDALKTRGKWEGEFWITRSDGYVLPTWSSVCEIRDETGAFTQYVSIFTDISIVKDNEARLAHLAHHDVLTGLPNRLRFTTHLEQALQRSKRDHDRGALLLLDLDRFKQINDTLGHAAGDTLLKEVGKRIKRLLRAGDTVARLSGDEFAVILAEIERDEDAGLVAEKLLEAISAPVSFEGSTMSVSASIGIAPFTGTTLSESELLRSADAAMYRAKASGRASYSF